MVPKKAYNSTEGINVFILSMEYSDRCSNARRKLILVSYLYPCLLARLPEYSLAVLVVEFISGFGKSRVVAQNIYSVFVGISSVGCVFAGFVVSLFGLGTSECVGMTLQSVGFFLGYFAESATAVILLTSVVAGLGTTLIYASILTIAAEYGGKRGRQWLVTFSVVVACGTAAGPVAFRFVISQYGWRGSCLLMSAALLQQIPMAMLVYVTERGSKRTVKGHWKGIQASVNKIGFWRLVKVIIACGLTYSIMYGYGIYIVDMVYSKGYTKDESAFVATLVGVGNIGGQLATLLYVLLTKRVSPIPFSVALLACAVIPFGYTRTDNYSNLCVLAVFHGVLVGVVSPLTKLLTKDNTDTSDMLNIGIGIYVAVDGSVRLSAGPIAGFIKDSTGSYDIFIYCVMVLVLLPLAAHASLYYFNKFTDFSSEIDVPVKDNPSSDTLNTVTEDTRF